MINFILKNLEAFPTASFAESELVRISKTDFNFLTKQKCLDRMKYDYMKEPYYSLALGDNGNERRIKKVGSRFYAYSVESADSAPIEVTEADLRRYQLSIPVLFEKIRTVNKIEGKFQEIPEGYFYVGYKLYDSFRVGFVFVPKIGGGKLVKFVGLKDICKDDKVLVVFTPFTKIEDILLNWGLSKCQIVTVPIATALDLKTFKLSIEDLIKEFMPEGGATALTKKQAKDYKDFDYKCYDKIHIPGTAPMKRSNDLEVNGHKIKMPDKPFTLFIELLVELKKGKGGWLTKKVDAGKYQIFDHVRKPLEGSLLGKDAKKFVENNASKQYRLSTHPDFITFNRKNLLRHASASVQALAKGLPKGGR
ncbi:MAG TPA: hypothetical protein PKY78_01845 [Candidatus Omnitrophota bacterium]|nr:hypothetical protein [Candidatus Omnitrophota bacterium]